MNVAFPAEALAKAGAEGGGDLFAEVITKAEPSCPQGARDFESDVLLS